MASSDPDRLKKMTDWDKLQGILKESPLDKKSNEVDEQKLLAHLMSRVKGQDEILKDVAKVIRLSWMKEKRGSPIANFLFLGPTGTGKTELAKAIAEYLYEGEKNMLRFDCSELASADMGKARLTGSSVGYVGSEKGGQLTRPMFANPRRLMLFDEIEKAHPLVFDLLLQLMGEGRLTEQSSGNTADFTQSIVVLTSNAQAEDIAKVTEGMTDYREIFNAIKGYLAEAKVFRPEVLGRIDKVYLFKPLGGMVIAEIALLKIAKLGRDYGLVVQFVAPELLLKALEENVKVSRFGIRELERILFDQFANAMVEARAKKAKSISFEVDPKGEIVAKHDAA
jgi:ATP-dependent Clp protease ATP-binding subunit ClpA